MEHNNISSNGIMHETRRILEGIGLGLIIVVSLCLNVTVCGIIWKSSSLRRKPTNVFVSNLCVSSLVMTLFVIPFSIATIIRAKHDTLNTAACEVNGFFSVSSCVSIVLTLCCISIDRYMAVTRPIKYKAIVTVKRAIFALIIVWTQGVLCGMLPIWGWARYKYHPGTLHCSPSWNDNCSLYLFLSIVGFVLPVLVMVVTYSRIFLTIRKHERKVTTKRWETQLKSGSKPNVFNKCKNNITVLSPSSLKPSRDVTLSNSDTCANLFTATPTELFSQDGFTCDEQNQDISSREGNVIKDHFLVKASLLSCKNTRTSRIAFAKDSKQSGSDDSASDNHKPSANQKPSSSSNEFESRRRVTSLIYGLRPHHGSRPKSAERHLPREYRVAKIGFLLLIAFLVLWTPYLVVHSCIDKFKFASTVFHVAMWCVYMNGIANPVVYALSNRSVKLAFKDMVRKTCAICCFSKR